MSIDDIVFMGGLLFPAVMVMLLIIWEQGIKPLIKRGK